MTYCGDRFFFNYLPTSSKNGQHGENMWDLRAKGFGTVPLTFYGKISKILRFRYSCFVIFLYLWSSFRNPDQEVVIVYFVGVKRAVVNNEHST